MKRLIVLGVLVASLAWAQTITDMSLMVGARKPLIYTGVDTIFARAGKQNQPWVQIGYSTLGSQAGNNNLLNYNPNIFTLVLDLDRYGAGDSVGLSKAWFNTAYDTTGGTANGYLGSVGEIWNADSTNFFLQSGNYSHAKYGDWMYELIKPVADSLSTDTTAYMYSLRVLGGNWFRLIFQNDTTITAANGGVVDTILVNWILYCVHGS